MKSHWLYLKYVLTHKFHVFRAGRELDLPLWQLIIHDLSKFRPSEWFPYANHFFNDDGTPKPVRDETGYYKPIDTGDAAFDYAWLLHQKRNPHHWQFWILPEDEGGMKVLPIPDKYRREMLSDWKGAGMAQKKPDTLAWYKKNRTKMTLHPETREWVEATLGYKESS